MGKMSKEELEKLFADIDVVRKVIMDRIDRYINETGDTPQVHKGTMECPLCKGVLHYALIGQHARARCEGTCSTNWEE